MEDPSLPGDPAAPLVVTPASPVAAERTPLLAPWWHTVAILLVLAAWASISGKRTHSYDGTPHYVTYISMMMMSWMLFGSVIAGITDRQAFFFSTLRHRAHTFFADFGRGVAVYLGFYAAVIAMVMVIAIGLVTYRATHGKALIPPATDTQTVGDGSAKSVTPVPPPAPASTDPLSPLTSRFHFKSKTVVAIAPRTAFDLLMWLAVSFTAGFSEEHIFRGYMLRQALALTQRAGASRLVAMILSVLTTSVLFGSLHLYEGIGGAAMIAVLGAFYSVVSLRLGNLRAVIVAHCLQDFAAGLFLFMAHRTHTL